jgi:putative nucleotidyltransferase with HDIG domain
MAEVKSGSMQRDANRQNRVLIVDDEPSIARLLTDALQLSSYSCLACQSGQEALRLLDAQEFDIVMSDVCMPGMTGLQLLRLVREKHPRLAFVMVTGLDEVKVAVQAMTQGADDYLLKPLNLEAVLVSINQVQERKRLEAELENYRLHLEEMVEQRTAQLHRAVQQIEQTYDETLQALAAALDLRDNETAGHSRRVMAYATEIARMMGCSREQVYTLARAALLHDIGKIGIADAILLKPGPFTAEERLMMETHVGTGYSLLKRIAFLTEAAEIVLTHHERFDGKGYPQGLAGSEIPLGARIFAVVDTFDALTSDRPYRQARTIAEAREEITRQSGTQFDPDVVSSFLSIDEVEWGTLRNGEGMLEPFEIGGLILPPINQIDRAYQQLEV